MVYNRRYVTMRKLLLNLLLLLAIAFGAVAQTETLTVNDGDVTNEYVPVYGYYADAYLKCEFVIPSTDLATMANGTITSMKFYLESPAESPWEEDGYRANFLVFLKEVPSATISSFYGTEGATIVYEGMLDGTQSEMEIVFNNDFVYDGGNLLVGIYNTEFGSYSRAYFYGVEAENACVQGYDYDYLDNVEAYPQDFLPKTTFTYVPGVATACTRPTNVTISNIDATSVTVSWTPSGTETSWQICLNNDEESLINVEGDASYNLTGLTAATTYSIKVRANCGESDGVSGWTNSFNFTTALCNSEDRCAIRYELTDMYDDGWQDASIRVVDVLTGEILAVWTAEDGEHLTEGTLSLCIGRAIRFEWIYGWGGDYECSYAVYDINNDIIFSGTGAYDEPFGYVVNCSEVSCIRPSEVHASNVLITSATISWTPRGPESAWVVKYGVAGFNVDTEGTEVPVESDPTLSLSDLAVDTEYDVYVKSNCGSDGESEWRMTSFRTMCSGISTFPWTEDFDDIDTEDLPGCWSYIDANADGDHWFVYGNEAAIYTYYNYGDNDDYLILPRFELDGDYVLSFDVQANSEYEPNDYEVVLSSTFATPESFTVTLQDLETVDYVEPERKSISLNDYHGSYFIAIHIPQGGLDGWYLYMDNFELRALNSDAEIVDFDFPTRMSAPVIDSANATVTVTASYQADLDNLEEVVTVSEGATYVENSVAVSENIVTYTYAVTSEDETVTREWTVTVTKVNAASTANDIISFTFDDQAGESIIDNEAKTVTAYAEWYVDIPNYDFYPEITVSPMATITPGSGEPQDFSEPVQYTVIAEDGVSTANWTVTITNDPNACINPYYIIIGEVTETAATMEWYKMYSETSYRVKVSTTEMTDMTAEADIYDDIVDLTSDEGVVFTLSELTPATAYYLYVQSNCNTEEWVENYFVTDCDGSAYSLPFVETFEYTSASRQCWTIVDANADYTSWDYYEVDPAYGETAVYSGVNTYYAANDWLISPKIAVEEGAYMTFDYATASEWYTEKFSVYVMDAPENYETATRILETQVVNNTTVATIPSIDLSAYAGQEIYIGIKCESTAHQRYLYIDNFKVELPPVNYTITLNVGEHGTVTYNGEVVEGVVTVGDSADITFTITPDEGYQIDALIVDGTPLYCDPTGETYTFTAVTNDHTLSVTFVETVSADVIEAGSMSIYPNPNNGMFSIDFSNIEGEAIYQLIDVRGVVVETRDINVMNGETMNFNYNLRAGTYFVRIINGDKVYVEQIVVE